MKEQVRKESKILSAAEKQMQAHSRLAEITDRLCSAAEPVPTDVSFGPYLAVSREKGACGGIIAEMVAHRLGWDVLGRSLVDRIAERYHLSKPMLKVVDETSANWAYDILGAWIDPHTISHEKYIAHLRHIVLTAARCGRVVFVGRGAQFFLPRRSGLAVRIVAPESYRVAQLVEHYHLDEKKARSLIKKDDQGRSDFVARSFHQDINNPHLYDLIINVANHGPKAAADLLVRLCSEFTVV